MSSIQTSNKLLQNLGAYASTKTTIFKVKTSKQQSKIIATMVAYNGTWSNHCYIGKQQT